MKYSLPKKIIYSIIVAVLLVGLVLTAFFGLNGKGYGSTYDIDLGLDLAGVQHGAWQKGEEKHLALRDRRRRGALLPVL